MTIVDMKNLSEAASSCEGAAYAVYEFRRIELAHFRRKRVRASFSDACLRSGLDFDLRAMQGETIDVLATEARYHDLLLAAIATDAHAGPGEWTPAGIVDLALRATSPVLALRADNHALAVS
ncbi:MAG: hypothetical protein R3C10_25410 [Pirellulales bacterium]